MKLISTIFILCLSLSFSVASNARELSAKHQNMDFKCKTCHTAGLTPPDDSSCLKCHGPIKDLIKSTAVKRAPHDPLISPNPHDSAHYGSTLSCFACHSEHKKPKLYCNTCHAFKYKRFDADFK